MTKMTEHHLAGELSVLLGQLELVTTTQLRANDLAQLRREAETRPLTALTSVVERALEVTDRLCWDTLQQGDSAAFTCQTEICAELYEFGVCAGLLEDPWSNQQGG
jgi:hypothetical protein